jgi:murein DD-endopeptidase MepM/ murein hydrolase activator NlpD
MTRPLLVLLAIALLLTGSAAGSLQDRQEEIQDKIAKLRQKIAAADERESVLTQEISSVTAKIRSLEDDVQRASARLDTIADELAVHKNRLALLTQIYQLQTERLVLLKRQFAAAERRLHRRIVAIYQEEDPSAIDVLLNARGFAEMLDQLDYLNEIGEQDRSIALQVASAKRQMARARAKTNGLRKDVSQTAKAVEVRLNAELEVRNQLVSAQEELAGARATKQRTLTTVQTSEKEFLEEAAALEQASRELAARIQAAQGAAVAPSVGTGGVSAQGLIWPVSGTLTSTFGPRWGSMHEGIDIAAPAGTSIVAAASGTVILAGWLGGYGNLVVIDHGGGLSTAYAHQSSIAVGVGQAVSQGQVIGYVGSTGHSTGNHLHFEVRVNGAAVDPLGYL